MATLKKTWTTDIGVNLVVDFASKNEKDWYVINDENYRPDKDKFVVEKFTEAFPMLNFLILIKRIEFMLYVLDQEV